MLYPLKSSKSFSFFLQFILQGPIKNDMEINKMKKPIFNLSKDEQRIASEIEIGDWKPVAKSERVRLSSGFAESANRKNKDSQVNLRLNPDDVAN